MVGTTGNAQQRLRAVAAAPNAARLLSRCKPALSALIMSAVVASASMFIQVSHAYAQDVKANLNHEMTGTVVDEAVQRMARNIAEKTDGRIDITVHSRGEMGGERAMFDLMQGGAIELGISGAAIISAVAPEFGVLDTPYLIVSPEHLKKVVEGEVGDEIRKTVLDKKGIRILGWMDRPPRHVTTKDRMVRKPQDMAGMKIRVREIPVQVEAFRMLGASPVPMAFGEVYTALQTGVIDAQENPLGITLGSSFNEVQDHVILTGHVREVQWLIASDSWWQKLSDKDRAVITEAAAEALQWGQNKVYAQDAAHLKEAKARGMKVVELSAAELKAFQDGLADLPKRFADVWKDGLFDRIAKAGE